MKPTNNMMLAVNAAIDGDKAEVDRLVKECDLDREELQLRIDKRDGKKYPMLNSHAKRSVLSSLNGQLSTVDLLRIQGRVEMLLNEKGDEELTRTKKLLSEKEHLEKKLAQIDGQLTS